MHMNASHTYHKRSPGAPTRKGAHVKINATCQTHSISSAPTLLQCKLSLPVLTSASTSRRWRSCQSTNAAAKNTNTIGIANVDGLQDYISAGPLLQNCGLSHESVKANMTRWLQLGKLLAKQLDFDHDHMDPIQKLRVYHYYLPVFFWCEAQLEAHRASGSQQAIVIGISAPQGCGKTTIVEQLVELFNSTGNTAASVSIDDFYLTYEGQTALAQSNPTNPLLQYRGNAGSHDLQLGKDTLLAVRTLTQEGKTASIPRYDKSAYSGRGDRAHPDTWPQVNGPVSVVLFEGWMSGFRPLPDDNQAEAVGKGLGSVNAALRGYKAAWDDLVDSWLVVRIGDPQWVYKWRLQAEEKMRASGKPGMTDEQIADFVDRYQPAYRAYLPELYQKGPTTAKPGKTLIIEVDEFRSPVPQQPPALK